MPRKSPDRRYPVSADRPLFRSRLDAGEELYFRRPFGTAEGDPDQPLRDVLCVALSDGAVEVAYPWAYLLGHELRRVPPAALDRWLHDAGGRPCIVIDDGLSRGEDLRRAVRALQAAGATTVRVAAPAMPEHTRRHLRGLGLPPVVSVVPATQAAVAPCLYAQAPLAPAVAAALAAECGRDDTWHGDGSLDQGPDGAAGMIAGCAEAVPF